MTCNKAQSMITPFIDNKLSISELEEFLHHVNDCSECMEELRVYYTLLTAMKQLDEDKNLTDNFNTELAQAMQQAEDKILHVKYTYYRKKAVLFIVIFFLAVFVGVGYADKRTEIQEQVTRSEFRIRNAFWSERNELVELQLKIYLELNDREQLPKE